MRPVGAWNEWDEPSRVRERAALSPICHYTDDDIDALYAELADLETAGLGSQDLQHQHALLAAKIQGAEEERAEEMRSYFARRGVLNPDDLSDLFQRIDAALGS